VILHTHLLWFAAGLTVSQRLIVIHPKYRDDAPLLAHERTHQVQMKQVGTLTFWWRYLTDKAFRQLSEVEAYIVQISHGASTMSCANHLASRYWLGLTPVQSLKLLET
jgi:hypothetical protein